MKYNSRTLDELCDVKIGKTPPRNQSRWFNSGASNDWKWVSIKDMGNCGKYISRTSETITDDAKKTFNYATVTDGTILLSFKLTLGRVVICNGEFVTNEAIVQLPIKDSSIIDRDYLYYYLKNYNWSNIGSTSSIATAVNSKMVKSIKVDFPDLETQQKIVRILSALDQKIELNDQENKNLETICDYLYKETIKNNDCKKTTIGSYCKTVITGGTPSTKDESFWGGNIPFVTIPDMHNKVFITNTERTITEAGITKSKITPRDSTIVSCIATVGLVSIASLECQTNQQINSAVPKNTFDTYFLYETLKNTAETLKAIGSTGSATLNVNKTAFSNVEIQIPNQEVIERYHAKVSPLFEKMHKNEVENLTLISLRDNLLSKLMTGEINLNKVTIK